MSIPVANLFLHGISIEVFQAIISTAVKNEFLEHLQNLSPPDKSTNDELLSKKQAAIFLKMSLPTLSKLVLEGVIPCRRIGSNIRFKKSELENSLTEVRNKKHNKYFT